MKTMYAILDVPYNYDFENDIDHHIYEACSMEEIDAELLRIGADDEHYSVEEYRIDDDGEFWDGSDYDTPSNFHKLVIERSNKIFHTCLAESYNYTDQDAFVSDLALSSIWGDDAAEIPAGRIEWLRQIWAATHRSVKEICKLAGMSQNAVADHFGIPRRTFGNWCTESRECPEYTKLMMQELLGLYRR